MRTNSNNLTPKMVLTILFLGLFINLHAQYALPAYDTLYTRDGKTFTIKMIDYSNDSLEFTNYSVKETPLCKTARSNIASIRIKINYTYVMDSNSIFMANISRANNFHFPQTDAYTPTQQPAPLANTANKDAVFLHDGRVLIVKNLRLNKNYVRFNMYDDSPPADTFDLALKYVNRISFDHNALYRIKNDQNLDYNNLTLTTSTQQLLECSGAIFLKKNHKILLIQLVEADKLNYFYKRLGEPDKVWHVSRADAHFYPNFAAINLIPNISRTNLPHALKNNSNAYEMKLVFVSTLITILVFGLIFHN